MRIAIVHYHLRTGGVSRIIELACRALLQKSGIRVAVLAGDIPPSSPIPNLVPAATVAGLDYQISRSSACLLGEELDKNARRLLEGTPDVWHFHNHSLGKNLALPKVVASWATEGRALLLQIHDFAENQRPENYRRLLGVCDNSEELGPLLYPSTPRIAYALLNSRDRKLLERTKFPGRLIHLPNPAIPLLATRSLRPEEFGTETLVVYPCRAIRRKNIGEALLLACALPNRSRLALTSGMGEEPASHKRWKALAHSWRIPVEFDACSRRNISLGDLTAAKFLLTTSIEEGFGMIFLESWLANKPLTGRDIPGVTTDFRSTGLVLDSLYDFLSVPISLIGRAKVQKSLLRRLEEKFSAVGMSADTLSQDASLRRALHGDHVDFGRLEPMLQERILHLASKSPLAAQNILPDPPPLPSLETVQLNRHIVEREYSLEKYGLRLTSAYHALASATAEPPASGDSLAILKEFFANNI